MNQCFIYSESRNSGHGGNGYGMLMNCTWQVSNPISGQQGMHRCVSSLSCKRMRGWLCIRLLQARVILLVQHTSSFMMSWHMWKHQWDAYPSKWVQGRRYCKWRPVPHIFNTTQKKNTKESADSVLACIGHSPPRDPGPQRNSKCSPLLHNIADTWRQSSGWNVLIQSHRNWSFSITMPVS